MHIAAARALHDGVLPAVAAACRDARGQASRLRSHRQDRPYSLAGRDAPHLGQEFSGYVAQLELACEPYATRYRGCISLRSRNGRRNGLNTHPQFADRACERVSRETGLPFVSAPNKFAALAGTSPWFSPRGAENARRRPQQAGK